MTNKEALDLIQKKIGCLTNDIDECSSMHCDDCLYDFIETDAVLTEMLKLAAVAIEKAERFKWHELEKDPNDLPKDMENVLVCWEGGMNNWYDSMFWDAGRKVFSSGWPSESAMIRHIPGDERCTDFGQAIAWRYIEPYEEDNE